MAQHLPAKIAAETVERRWMVGGTLSGVSTSASGVTVDSATVEGGEIVLVLSAGTEATTGEITATITTSDGQALVEVFYIPIIAATASGATVRDICGFALRKINGLGVDADAVSEADAMERLRDMLALWRDSGADIGASAIVDANTVIYCKDAYLSAVKNNLILQLADLYEVEPTPMVVENARRGLQAIKQANLPDDRGGVSFF